MKELYLPANYEEAIKETIKQIHVAKQLVLDEAHKKASEMVSKGFKSRVDIKRLQDELDASQEKIERLNDKLKKLSIIFLTITSIE